MLQENPLLEKAEATTRAAAGAAAGGPAAPAKSKRARAGRRRRGPSRRRRSRPTRCDRAEPVEPSDFDDYSPGESDWSGTGGGRGDDDDDEASTAAGRGVHAARHLYGQLAVLNLALRDRQIIAALIDAVDEDAIWPPRRRIWSSCSRGVRDRGRRDLDRAALPAELRACRRRRRDAAECSRCS